MGKSNEKAKEVLTEEEKIGLLTGTDNWHTSAANGKLRAVRMSDGPSGLRKFDDETSELVPATAMPTLSLVACTWDEAAARADGETIADDCLEENVDVLLAPGVNIKRTPLCGRNFEYFSEDPLLAGRLAKAFVEGVQSKGVGTSVKHFAANNREYDRCFQSSEVDERTLREIYLPAFETAIKARPWTVMCSYNPVNGVWASENKRLLGGILRGEFGFDGLIVSDWDAVHSPRRAVKASLDLIMPHYAGAEADIAAARESGFLTDGEIDACAERVARLSEKAAAPKQKAEWTKEERHARALEIAKGGMVLLKNEGGILPLRGGNWLVGGNASHYPSTGGGGSSAVRTEYRQRPLSALLAPLVPGLAIEDEMPNDVYAKGLVGAKRLYAAAYGKDGVILVLNGTDESEGYDRTTLRLPRHIEELICRLSEVNENLVVVLEAGSAVDMSAWIGRAKAVLYAGFAGEAANEAIAALLSGAVSPSGKLAETFPLSLADTPTGEATGDGFVDRYEEGVFVGYRWYDSKKKDVLFPFGHGLGYAEFAYSDLAIEKKGETDYRVSYTIENVSSVPAKEVSEVYVRDVFAMVSRPEKELKGFSKDEILPGEKKRVSVDLDFRSFAYYSTELGRWHVENGTFEILVGASSRDIRLTGKIEMRLPEETQMTRMGRIG